MNKAHPLETFREGDDVVHLTGMEDNFSCRILERLEYDRYGFQEDLSGRQLSNQGKKLLGWGQAV